jgi:hypothetical protein
MTRPVILNPTAWRKIRDNLKTRHPSSHLLIRSKMRERLGFTVREHRAWVNGRSDQEGYYQDQVHLDFYDERKRSLFLLTYGDQIGREVTEA